MAKLLDPVTYYKASRWLYIHRVPLLPRLIKVFQEIVFHCEIPFTAKIGPGLQVHHRGFGIVVHPRAELGRNVTLSPCVTIGGRNGGYDVPRLGDGVFVASGAKILGDVEIGDGAVVGANAVVIRSVPAHCVAAGVPARIIRQDIESTDRAGLTGVAQPEKTAAAPDLHSHDEHHERPRVVSFIQSLELGGSETQCVEVAARMAEQGYLMIIGCMSAQGPLKKRVAELGLPLVEFPTPRLLRPSAIRQLVRLVRFLRLNKVKVVHTNDLYSNLFAVPAAWLAGVPVIISSQRDMSHWSWYTPRRRRVLRNIQRRSSWLLVNSEAIRDDLIQRDRFAGSKIRVVYNGVDTTRYAKNADGPRPFLPGVDPGDRLIAMVANMHIEVKGHEDLISAAHAVSRKYPRARFLLIGDGEMRSRFERKVRTLDLERSVFFLGHRTDVPDILSCCDVGVLASRAEGLPNAVLEYMASGLAVVATHVGGVPEIIRHGIDGLLVPARDPLQLSVAICRLLGDESYRKSLADAARNRTLDKFDFSATVRTLKDLYLGRGTGVASPGPQNVNRAVGSLANGEAKYSLSARVERGIQNV